MKKIFIKTLSFFKKLISNSKKLHRLLSKKEKILVYALLIIILVLGFYRIRIFINDNTVSIPKYGGEYSEVLVGELKYPNPILAKSYVDRTVSSLVYSGLTSIDSTGKILPLLAESWTMPEEGKKYIFKLRQNVYWHDGMKFTAKDVAFTIKNIQDSSNQSPYLENWGDVQTKIIDDYTIEFSLAERSAPFLAATRVGIIPAHIQLREENRKVIGTGPYLVKKIDIADNEIAGIELESNEKWFNKRPWIQNITFHLADSLETGEKVLQDNELISLSGKFYRAPKKAEKFQIFTIPTETKILLFINANAPELDNLENRKKILNNEKVELRKLSLLTESFSLNSKKAREFIDQAKKNLNFSVIELPAGVLQEKIQKREYDALLIPVELGSDKDLYPFFHSSQRKEKGFNFANIADKELDLLLEQARVNLDEKARSDLQQKIDEKITNLAIYKDLDQVSFYWLVDKKVKNVEKITSLIQPEDRFNKVNEWYIEEKLVLKRYLK